MTVIWCMVPEIWSATDRTFCHFGLSIALIPPTPPTPLTIWKIKIWKNEKTTWIYYILWSYTCVPKMTIIWSMVPEISSTTDRIFCHSGPFFALLPRYGPRKTKFLKNEKKPWKHYHFTNVYHKWQSYDVWFLRYGVQRTEFLVILDHFLLFYPPNSPKN